MNPKKTYGWVPDLPDQRDYLYQSIRPRIGLPKKVDLRNGCSAVEDQGQLGSCTAQALAGNLEFLDRIPDKRSTDVSRLFIYYNERVLIHSVDSDSGAQIRDGIKTLKNDGVCLETSWPYQIERFQTKPSPACYREAKSHTIASYHRLLSLQQMITCLADGFPFVFGFSVYESFESAQVAKTGILNLPKKNERVVGGHAVMAVGYDQSAKRFMVRNSWGPKWGTGGYFTMPFHYLETLADDFWTIRK